MQHRPQSFIRVWGLAAWVIAGALTVAPCFAAGLAPQTLAPASRSVGSAAAYQPNHAAQGYLGIGVRDVQEDQVASLKLRDTRGAVIVKVDHDGPAGKMGLRERDVVLQMNGTAIEGEEQMRRLLRDIAPGHPVALLVSRDGQQIAMATQMADREQVDRQAWMDHLGGPQAPATGLPTGEEAGSANAGASGPPVAGGRYGRSFLPNFMVSATYTGAVLEKMGSQLAGFFGVQGATGLLVRSVETNSPAAISGMRAGDVIVRANAHGVDSLSQWVKLIKDAKGRPVVVVVMRDRMEKTLMLTPDAKRRSSLDAPSDSRLVAWLTAL